MGAAILLQSLAVEHDFCAVAAESSFSSFVAVAPERAAHIVGLKPRSHIFTGLPIYAAAVYVKIRYGFNFFKANPAAVVHRTKTPVLLIHGEDDQEILPWHSQYMAHMNPDHVQLWIVPKAEHLNSSDVAPEEFEARIFGWFHTHTVALDAKR